MPRQLVLFVVLALFLTACSKKAEPPDGAPAPEPRGVDSDPNAVYSLKIRPVQKGDKTEVVRRESSAEVRRGGANETLKLGKHFEYSEHILEMPEGAPLPTRLTRDYKVAQKIMDPKAGELKPLAFEGKTVAIAKRGAFYQYTVDGKPLAQPETIELDAEFRDAEKVKIDTLLPEGPVKIGERWPVRREILQAFGTVSADTDFSKSSLSAVFTRAYTLDGKQWGQITFDFELVIDPSITGGKVRGPEGTLKTTGTFDIVIDGTSRDSIMKGSVKGELAGYHKASAVKSEIDTTFEKTARMVK
jgi:hypothetical protein